MGKWEKVPYILEKDGERLEFDSLSAAAKFLGVKHQNLYSAAKRNGAYCGYKVYKKGSEPEPVATSDVSSVKPTKTHKNAPKSCMIRKDGEVMTFPSQRAAAAYIGVRVQSIHSAMLKGHTCKGYEIVTDTTDLTISDNLYRIWGAFQHKQDAVDKDWIDYDKFKAWAESSGYTDDMELRRIDKTGGWNPANCKWIPKRGHSLKSVDIDGEVHSLVEWSAITGISYETLARRYYRGKRGADLIATRSNTEIPIEIDGEVHSLSEWARITGINYMTLWMRYDNGRRGLDLIAPKGQPLNGSKYTNRSDLLEASTIYQQSTREGGLYTAWERVGNIPGIHKCKYCGFMLSDGYNDVLKTFRYCPNCREEMKSK